MSRYPFTTLSVLAISLTALTGPSILAQPKPGPYVRSGTVEYDRMLKAHGGNMESQAAVARGLAWLARQQQKDGSWEFDGGAKDHKVAATGMALLPFLVIGETPKEGTKYKKTVEQGLNWLTGKQVANGSMGTNNMYAHAIATIALCEAAGRTKDPKVTEKATAAVAYIVGAQGRNGSWGYTGPNPTEGDTSITGWQIQALAAAEQAGIAFDKAVYKKADKYLQSVSTDDGAKYGYRDRSVRPPGLSAVGLLSRHSIGTMKGTDPPFAKGIEYLLTYPPQKGYFDMYYYYYATRVVLLGGGDTWHKTWNPRMRDMLIDLQQKDGDDATKGSWKKDQGFIGSQCGRLGTTALAVLTLEVYYRHAPTPPLKDAEVPAK